MKLKVKLEFDGGSRGNPGPAALGVVLRGVDGQIVASLGRYIGTATNNVAEYNALIAGLELAKGLGVSGVDVFGDSQLVIKQMRGEYRVKHPAMRPLYEKACRLAGEFDEVTFTYNRRYHNAEADRLANLAMDRKGEVEGKG